MPVQVSVKKKNLLFNKVHLETKEKVPKAKGKTHVIAHFVTRADKRHQRKLHLWLLFLSLQLGKILKNMTCTLIKLNTIIEQSEPMRSSHISQLVCYISDAGILSAFGIPDLLHTSQFLEGFRIRSKP
mgnify:CR=1 FL=1